MSPDLVDSRSWARRRPSPSVPIDIDSRPSRGTCHFSCRPDAPSRDEQSLPTNQREKGVPSLFLGRVGKSNESFEVHAFTRGSAFREYPTARIADARLFENLVRGRFEVLRSGRPMYCTAVRPDPLNRTEINPHDERDGTVHLAALNSHGHIVCGLSIAVDIGAQDRGAPVGVPLENVWQSGDYPVGASLEPFRARYIRVNKGIDRNVAPWEAAELYRHFKTADAGGGVLPRLALYTGLYHLLVRAPLQISATPTSLGV